MKKQIEVCDFCEVTTENQHLKVGSKKCTICSKWACENKCAGVADAYYTTSHFPWNGYSSMAYSFICEECWENARLVDCKLISQGVGINGSGSSWAIRLGEYVTLKFQEKFKELDAQYVNEVRRLIKLSTKLKADQLKKELKSRQMRSYVDGE